MQTSAFFLLLTCTALCFSACQSEQKAPESPTSESPAAPQPAQSAANTINQGLKRYCFITADDTAILSLRVTGDRVLGEATFEYMGKDRNDGMILNGEFHGDTLYADYRFFSEGTQSMREIAFLIRNGQAIEGYGQTEMRNGKQVIVDRNKLQFIGPTLSQNACRGNVDAIPN